MLTVFQVFERKVREAGLYGQAFFGFRATTQETQLIGRLWLESRQVVRNLQKVGLP